MITEYVAHLLARTVAVDECWVWTGSKTNGYGKVKVPGSNTTARVHRLVYEALVGPIPDGLDLDHLCRNRACCRPAHLEPVTRRENLLRGNTIPAARAAQTHCSRGHEFSEDNIYIGTKGGRECRACRRYYKQRDRAAKTTASAQ
jgi:hypothetical protein